jgi:hypothetical protein
MRSVSYISSHWRELALTGSVALVAAIVAGAL